MKHSWKVLLALTVFAALPAGWAQNAPPAPAAQGGDADFVRLLTDQGVKTIVVPHQRVEAVTY